MLTTEVTKVPFLATDPPPPCICHVLVGWIIGRKLQGSHHCIHNWSLQNSVPIIWWCDIPILRYVPRKSNIGFFCWLVYYVYIAHVTEINKIQIKSIYLHMSFYNAFSNNVTIGQCIYICIGHSGGSRSPSDKFVGDSRWWRALRWQGKVFSLSRVLEWSRPIVFIR